MEEDKAEAPAPEAKADGFDKLAAMILSGAEPEGQPAEPSVEASAPVQPETVKEEPKPEPSWRDIRLPEDPEVPKFFQGKPVSEALKSNLEAQHKITEQGNQLADLRRQLEDERTKRITLETIRGANTQEPPADQYQRLGLAADDIPNAEQAAQLADERAQQLLDQRVKPLEQALKDRDDRDKKAQSDQLILAGVRAAEESRKSLVAEGYAVSEEQWAEQMEWMIPALIYEHGAYAQKGGPLVKENWTDLHKKANRTTPSPVIASEVVNQGNPPGSKKSASQPQEPAEKIPTLKGEDAAIAQMFGRAGFNANKLAEQVAPLLPRR